MTNQKWNERNKLTFLRPSSATGGGLETPRRSKTPSRSVSVVIPTLNAGAELDELLNRLERQTQPPDEILIIDSTSDDDTLKTAKKHPLVKTHIIPKNQFNHGGTRHLAFSMTMGDVVVFMTQDAIPKSETLIERLIRPLEETNTIAVYARQLPKEDAKPREQLVRVFNYPEQSELHTKADIPTKGIKTFFLSDVCAAYRRKEYEELGGFETNLKSNEDMFFAAKAIQSGYAIAYAADAEVYHSHNLTLKEQYRRNKLQGYEIERHKELLGNTSSSTEGVAMLKDVSKKLLKQGRILSIFALIFDCVARYLGSRAGAKEYSGTSRKVERKEQVNVSSAFIRHWRRP